MAVLVFHFLQTLDTIRILVADAKGQKSASYDVNGLSLHVTIRLKTGVVIDGDGITTRDTRVYIHRAGYSCEDARTIDTDNLMTVVVKNHLCQVDVGDRHQHHVEFLYIHVPLRVVNKPFKFTID